MIPAYTTPFPNSSASNQGFLDQAHKKIDQTGQHPIAVFDGLLMEHDLHYTLLEDIRRNGKDDKKVFMLSHFRKPLENNTDVAQRYLFPEPAQLLDICLHMGVHPADLCPDIPETPSPRSVVQLCADISKNPWHTEFDHDLAKGFLAHEKFLIIAFQQKYPELWDYLDERAFIVENSSSIRTPAEQREFFAKTVLGDAFSRTHKPSPYPQSPDVLSCRLAIEPMDDALFELQHQIKINNEELIATSHRLRERGEDIFGKGKAFEAHAQILERLSRCAGNSAAEHQAIRQYISDHSLLDFPLPQNNHDWQKLTGGWLDLCKLIVRIERNLDAFKKAWRDKKRRLDDTHKSSHFGKLEFDQGLSFYENKTIIEAEDHAVPGLSDVLRFHLSVD